MQVPNSTTEITLRSPPADTPSEAKRTVTIPRIPNQKLGLRFAAIRNFEKKGEIVVTQVEEESAAADCGHWTASEILPRYPIPDVVTSINETSVEGWEGKRVNQFVKGLGDGPITLTLDCSRRLGIREIIPPQPTTNPSERLKWLACSVIPGVLLGSAISFAASSFAAMASKPLFGYDEILRRYKDAKKVKTMLRAEATPLGNWTVTSVSEAKYLMKVTESATQPAPATSYQPEAQAIAVHDRAKMMYWNKATFGGSNAASVYNKITHDMPRDPSLYYYFVPHRLQPTDCIEVTEFRFNKCGAKMNKILPLATPPPGREQPNFPGLIHFSATDPMSFALIPSYDDVTQLVGEGGTSELHKMGSAAASKAVTQVSSSSIDLEAVGAVKDDLEAVSAVKDAASEALEERSDRKSRDVLKRMGFRKCSLPDSLYEVTCPPGTTPKQRCALMLYVLNEMAEELA